MRTGEGKREGKGRGRGREGQVLREQETAQDQLLGLLRVKGQKISLSVL